MDIVSLIAASVTPLLFSAVLYYIKKDRDGLESNIAALFKSLNKLKDEIVETREKISDTKITVTNFLSKLEKENILIESDLKKLQSDIVVAVNKLAKVNSALVEKTAKLESDIKLIDESIKEYDILKKGPKS